MTMEWMALKASEAHPASRNQLFTHAKSTNVVVNRPNNSRAHPWKEENQTNRVLCLIKTHTYLHHTFRMQIPPPCMKSPTCWFQIAIILWLWALFNALRSQHGISSNWIILSHRTLSQQKSLMLAKRFPIVDYCP